jgi:probable HAF family extracellular repeat protein
MLWDNGNIQYLGSLGNQNGRGYAYGINDSCQIVGTSYTSEGIPYAFLWQNGEIISLGALDISGGTSEAFAVNNNGQIVGSSTHAFLWEDGIMYNLNDLVVNLPSGWILNYARDINDLGQIVGWGPNSKAFLLTPIPEPSIMGLILLGAMLGIKWRRRD